jgi:hypothetical protein
MTFDEWLIPLNKISWSITQKIVSVDLVLNLVWSINTEMRQRRNASTQKCANVEMRQRRNASTQKCVIWMLDKINTWSWYYETVSDTFLHTFGVKYIIHKSCPRLAINLWVHFAKITRMEYLSLKLFGRNVEFLKWTMVKGVEFDQLWKNNCSLWENCHVTVKSYIGHCMCKEMMSSGLTDWWKRKE